MTKNDFQKQLRELRFQKAFNPNNPQYDEKIKALRKKYAKALLDAKTKSNDSL